MGRAMTADTTAEEQPYGGYGYLLLALDCLAFWVVVILGLFALLS